MKYADLILPLPVDSYTYRIPPAMEATIAEGCRVLVNFGRKRYYTAIVTEVHECTPAYETKDIYALLGTTPILRPPQFRFWEWIASYYLCKTGEVYNAALPSGLKVEGDTSAIYRKKGFAPRTQTFIRLSEVCRDEARLQEVFSDLKRAPKQEALLLSYLDLSHALNPRLTKELSRKELLEQTECTPSALDALLKRGVLESYEKEVGRLQPQVCRVQPPSPLSEAQKRAYEEILEQFKTKDVCLLHGVTSSGKTEIYSHLIEDVLKLGRQVLFLLPEIAITTQITERLGKIFGDKLLVYHSKFSDNERVEVWNKLLHNDGPMLVLGVRSSLFLPFKDLGLIIVDEEHENTYKQQDPAPRYHARNAATVLARMHGGKTLLGSATPSIDSYYNALTGKYGLVELKTRFGDCLMPEITVVDIKELRRKKIMKNTLFSPLLTQKVNQALENGEQVILFQNRRGFAPMIECKSCGWVPHCPNCDVSLTYHKAYHRLECHYCGHVEELPRVCPSCHGEELKMLGFGTEKIEEEVEALFPSANVERMDMDSARTRTAYEHIISDFEAGKTQILIGTQMLSKGLDFGNVSVVGILNADSMLNFPDFRAHERAFQLMVQVSGRAGRRDKQGCVILQTSQPELSIIQIVQHFAYQNMVTLQLSERSMFHYPPYYRLIILYLRGKQEETLQELSTLYAGKLRERLGERVLGPVTPPVTRIQNLHVRQIILKIEIVAAIAPVREILDNIRSEILQYPPFKQLLVHYDVDPA
ncbi:primosomal protein N' [Bacteroidia bacterium]|nr:primosomal protein N' [Bacteroidia bacterium]